MARTEIDPPRKRIALVAHDNKKNDLLEWARFNREALVQHELYATGTTGKLLEQELVLFHITTLDFLALRRLKRWALLLASNHPELVEG